MLYWNYEGAVQFAGRHVEELNASSYYANADSDTFWLDFHDVFAREMYFPGVEQAGTDARNAMMAFFEEDPSRIDRYIGGDWSWSRRRVLGHDYAVLSCKAPLLREVGDLQCFLYHYNTNTVSYGPSGSSVYNVADEIRYVLKNWDSNNVYPSSRDCFAQYFYLNSEELNNLVENERIQQEITYQDETVYYRLQRIEKNGSDTFSLYFEGMAVANDTDSINRSNRSTLDRNYPWKHYQDREQEAILRAMASNQSFYDQGLSVCEQLTVHVRLKNGDQPFEYLDVSLETLNDSSCPLRAKYWHEPTKYYYHYADSTDDHPAQIIFTAAEPLYQVQFLEMQFKEDHYQPGKVLYEIEALNRDHSLVVDMVFTGGVVEQRGIAYTDSEGVKHTFVITLSGKTGSIVLLEVTV